MSETTKAPTFTRRLMFVAGEIERTNAALTRMTPGSIPAITMLMAAYFHPEWARAAAELLLAESTTGGEQAGRPAADQIVEMLPIEMEMPQ